MKQSSIIKIGFALGVLALMGFMAVQAVQQDMGGMMNTAKEGKECTMADMQGCVTECMKHCDKNKADLSAAMTALDTAVKEITAGNTAAAKSEIEKAQKLLKDIQEVQKKCMAKMPVCNTQCPITGKKIDMMNVPENLTTMYKGQKIGFCCPACPPAWEKLTDKEKEAKLEPIKFKASEKAVTKEKLIEKM